MPAFLQPPTLFEPPAPLAPPASLDPPAAPPLPETVAATQDPPTAPRAAPPPVEEPVLTPAAAPPSQANPSPSTPRPLLDDIDETFESILSSPPGGSSELTSDELAEAQKLFLDISSSYLAPVRDLMIELTISEPSKEWLSVCRPSLQALKRAASDMLLTPLADALGTLSNAMEQTERTTGTTIDARGRESLKSAYAPLVKLLPEAFEVNRERDRREPIIVQALLRQVPDVRKVAIDRMLAAGLTSLEIFYKAKPTDIAEAAGISRELSERIVARFQRYRREVGSIAPAPRRTRELTQLSTLTRKLEEQNLAFDAASRAWSQADETRRVRQERAATVLEIQLLLARLGEVALLEQLERVPFHRKAEELRRYLSNRKDSI
ncbi:MAG TPA: helix-hairpin-helix domain-containing protein [Polyangiaceae bacterium]|nr:helix-hairpin-helix domain-containing protein [Polyangiaceae bacterium]